MGLKRPGAIIAMGSLVGGLAIVAAALAIGLTMTPKDPAEIVAFESHSAFSAATSEVTTVTFDETPTGTSDSSLASIAGAVMIHSTAALFRTEGGVYASVSPPNVLAPFTSEATLALGIRR